MGADQAWCTLQMCFYFKELWNICIEQIAWNPLLWKNTQVAVGSLGSHGRTHSAPWLWHICCWMTSKCILCTTSQERGMGACPRAGNISKYTTWRCAGQLKRGFFFISRCVGKDFSMLWGRCFVSCSMRKALALCPGMDTLTMRTLGGEVWCERSGSPKLSLGLVA